VSLHLLLAAGQHFEEVKYLTGQIGRLKDKLGLAERDLAVAHAIKVRTAVTNSLLTILAARLPTTAAAAACSIVTRMPACLQIGYDRMLLLGSYHSVVHASPGLSQCNIRTLMFLLQELTPCTRQLSAYQHPKNSHTCAALHQIFNVLLQEKYRSALEAASINIAELDAAAATANAAAAAAGPTTAAARTAVRRSLGGTSTHHLLGLSPPASPEPVVHGGSRRLSGQVTLKSPGMQGGRASVGGLPPVSPKPAFRPAGSASPGFGR
jgi:hypothetical protein